MLRHDCGIWCKGGEPIGFGFLQAVDKVTHYFATSRNARSADTRRLHVGYRAGGRSMGRRLTQWVRRMSRTCTLLSFP